MRFFISALVLWVFVVSSPAWACSCPVDAFGPEASHKNIARAAYIIEGSVSFVAPQACDAQESCKGFIAFGITPRKILKGQDLAVVTAYARIGTTCGVSTLALQRMDFFVLYPRSGENAGEYRLATTCEGYIAPEDRIALMRGLYKPPVK